MSRAQGWEAGPGQLGKVVGEIRRAMSVTIVRANSLCLLERLSQLGPGARAAAQRRQAALHLEERRRQERQAFDLAWQARRSSRVGRAFIELWSFVKIYLPFSSILILLWCCSCNIHLINGIQENKFVICFNWMYKYFKTFCGNANANMKQILLKIQDHLSVDCQRLEDAVTNVFPPADHYFWVSCWPRLQAGGALWGGQLPRE